MSGNVIKDQPLEVFGKWQTELYTPPPAENGKVNFSKLLFFSKQMSDSSRMIYPLDSQNTKKPKTRTAGFFVNTRISVKFFQKKPK